MEIVDPRDFFTANFFRENDFREAVQKADWARYKDKPVLIEGCSSVLIPTWAFMVLAAELVPYAKSVHFGEVKSPIPVFGKLGSS